MKIVIQASFHQSERKAGRFDIISKILRAFKISRKIVKFVKIIALFFNNKTTYDLTNVPASVYDRKSAARPFDTIHEILKSHGLAQSLLKGQNAPIRRVEDLGDKNSV